MQSSSFKGTVTLLFPDSDPRGSLHPGNASSAASHWSAASRQCLCQLPLECSYRLAEALPKPLRVLEKQVIEDGHASVEIVHCFVVQPVVLTRDYLVVEAANQGVRIREDREPDVISV